MTNEIWHCRSGMGHMSERTLVLKFSGVMILIVQGSNQSNDLDDTLVMRAKGKCAAVSRCWFYPYIIQGENTRHGHVRWGRGKRAGAKKINKKKKIRY